MVAGIGYRHPEPFGFTQGKLREGSPLEGGS